MLNSLKNKEILLDMYKKRRHWKGCFGAITIISYDFLKKIDTKYNIFNLLSLIKTRRSRICFEIVFACILHSMSSPNSLLGDIKYYCKWGIKFKDVQRDIKNLDKIKLPLIKVWTGR